MTTNRISRYDGTNWNPIYDSAASLASVTAGGTTIPITSTANTLAIAAGTGVTVAGATGPNTVTLSIGQSVATTASPTFSTITATTGFSGPGGSLTALSAGALSSGTVLSARLSGAYTGITGVGTLTTLAVTNGTSPAMLLGSTWSNNTYAAITVTGMPTAGYGMIMNIVDTFISSGSGSTFLRGPGNDASHQVQVSNTVVTVAGGLTVSSGVISATHAGSTTANGDASIRASANAAKTGISVLSTAVSTVTDFFMAFYDTNNVGAVGSIQSLANTSGTVYQSASDYRLKRDDVRLTGSLAKILALRPISFYWKFPDSPIEQGFFAHEVQSIFPTAAFGEKDAVDEDGNMITQQMELSRLVPALVNAVQELAAKVQVLEDRLTVAGIQ